MAAPKVIPPKTVVRLSQYDDYTPAWGNQIGQEFRVGYYSPSDGLDCIWLVDDAGDYVQTTDRETLLSFFDVPKLSREPDGFGRRREPLCARRHRRRQADL